MSKSGKLLVTGGSGFIGSKVVELALRNGYDVRNFDIAPPSIPEHSLVWVKLDINAKDLLLQKTSEFRPDFVIHLASDVDITLRNLADYRTILNGTHNIVSVARLVPNLQRLIHVSTQYVLTPGVQPVSETHFEPYTVYGEAKAISERTVRESNLKSWLIVRPTIIWGPGHPSFPQLIWKYIAKRRYLHPASRVPIVRCYGFVRNTAEQMLSFIDVDESKLQKRVFYLGDSNINYDLWADAFSKGLTNKPARRIPKSALLALGWVGSIVGKTGLKAPIDRGRCFRMTTSTQVDLKSTFDIIGHPKIAFDEGIRETIDWLETSYPNLYLRR
jgi:nucleoside-diphosphate-sugar epimerase